MKSPREVTRTNRFVLFKEDEDADGELQVPEDGPGPGPVRGSIGRNHARWDPGAEAPRQPPGAGEDNAPRAILAVTLAADADLAEPTFVWPPYLMDHALNVLDGPGGAGKGRFAAFIAARISKGFPFPDQRMITGTDRVEPGHVIFYSTEDAKGFIARRLKQAHGDLTRVSIVEGTTVMGGEARQLLDPLTELHLLEDLIRATDARMVLFDHLTTLAAGVRGLNLDLNKATHMRVLLQPFQDLARRTRTCVVVLRHTRKDTRGGAEDAGIGSQDIRAIARSGFLMMPDPAEIQAAKDTGDVNPDGTPPTIGVIVHHKHNETAEGAAMKYRIDDAGFHLLGTSDMTANTAYKHITRDGGTKHASAKAAILAALRMSDHYLTAAELEEAVLSGLEVSMKTFQNARAELVKLGVIEHAKLPEGTVWREVHGPARAQ